MSGRYEQLGRQLRKVRTSLAKHDPRATSVALRRATHLAADLVLEQVEGDDAAAALGELVSRNVLDAALGDRVSALLAARDARDAELTDVDVTARGRDLDRLLRSLEHGASMPELSFAALDAVEVPPAESRASLTISGRHVVLAARGGEGMVFVDDRAIGAPFPMRATPTSKAEVTRDPSGTTSITWEAEGLALDLGSDFATVTARAAA